MPFTEIVNDTFTDVNGTLLTAHSPEVGGSWATPIGSHDIFSNRVGAPSGTSVSVNLQAAENDQAAEGETVDRGSQPAVCIRGVNAADAEGYRFRGASFGRTLDRFDASGSSNTELDAAGSITNGDVMRIEAVGDEIVTYLNSTPDLSVTDATYSDGLVGVMCEIGAALADFIGEHQEPAGPSQGVFSFPDRIVLRPKVFAPGRAR